MAALCSVDGHLDLFVASSMDKWLHFDDLFSTNVIRDSHLIFTLLIVFKFEDLY